MDLFFNQLKKPTSLSKVLSIDLTENANFIAVLQKGIINNSSLQSLFESQAKTQLEKFVDNKLASLGVDNGTRFNMLVTSYLQFVALVDPWSTWNNVDLIFDYYTNLTNLVVSLTSPSSVPYETSLCILYQKMTIYVIQLSKKIDSVNATEQTQKYLFTTQVSVLLSKYFQTIKPLVIRGSNPQIDSIYGDDEGMSNNRTTPSVSSKFKLLLWVVNRLNNLYFYIKSPKSSYTIFNNMSHKIDSRALKNLNQEVKTIFNMIDVLEYRFLLGRAYMVQNKIVDSYYQLNECFNGLLSMILYYQQANNSDISRKLVMCLNKTFKLLVPMGIAIGKTPFFIENGLNGNSHSNNNMNNFITSSIDPKLIGLYRDLGKCVLSGNMQDFSQWIAQNKTFLISQNLYLVLIEKLPLIIFRNCVKKIFTIYCFQHGSYKLAYDVLEVGLQKSLKNNSFGNFGAKTETDQILDTMFSNGIDVENLLSTLITYNWLKGNIFPMSKVLLTMKSANIKDIFPDINEKITHRFPLNEADGWISLV